MSDKKLDFGSRNRNHKGIFLTINVAVFGSGIGSNFQAIFTQSLQDKLDVKFALIVSNNSQSGILEFAKHHHVDTFVYHEAKYENSQTAATILNEKLSDYQIDYILLAGYMKKIPSQIIHAYPNKILNIHPSLLPSFGGKGMYGNHVHQAVFDSGVKITGATIHFVDDEYDKGPIIKQQSVLLKGHESVEEISKAVLEVEHKLYYDAFKSIVLNQYQVNNNKVVLT